MRKVLIVGTSSKTRGGITAVITAHSQAEFWNKWNCYWIETHVDRSVLLKVYYFAISFIKYLLQIRTATIVHFHLSGPGSAKRKYIFLRVANFFRKPIIIHYHAFSVTSNIDKKNIGLYTKIFGYADKLVVLSENWKMGIIENLGINPSKIEVIYNPCPQIKPHFHYPKKKTILYAGTLNKRKGYENLIKAFAIIAPKYPDWQLIFAGNGEIENAGLIAAELSIKSQTIFKGWVARDEKHKIFAEASIFCLPSFAEGFPMAVLDAWAYGLPVITTPVGGIPDVAINGENMLLFDPADVNKLAHHIEELIKNSNLRAKLATASVNLSKKNFSLSQINIQIDNMYNDIYHSNLNTHA